MLKKVLKHKGKIVVLVLLSIIVQQDYKLVSYGTDYGIYPERLPKPLILEYDQYSGLSLLTEKTGSLVIYYPGTTLKNQTINDILRYSVIKDTVYTEVMLYDSTIGYCKIVTTYDIEESHIKKYYEGDYQKECTTDMEGFPYYIDENKWIDSRRTTIMDESSLRNLSEIALVMFLLFYTPLRLVRYVKENRND